jgi:hypothetical protein
MVAYLPSLRTVLQRLRATSSTPSSLYTSPQLPTLTPSLTLTPLTSTTHTSSPITGNELGGTCLNSQFPLPGAMAVAPPTLETTPTKQATASAPLILASVSEKEQGLVECLVQQCPPSLHAGFMDLFPGVTVEKGELLVITLCQKTTHDMTAWSHSVGEEREQLMQHFVESAKEICARLSSESVWSDFIDPYSGRAFYSPHSNVVLQETDERFRYLGFDVRDLGCCRSIAHPMFGSHAFVGTIFTSASIQSPSIQSIMDL